MTYPVPDKYDFPHCMHALAAAMHIQEIDPANVVISLPKDAWWRLYCALERRFHGMMVFDGRGAKPHQFCYMGFTFELKAES